MALEAAFQALSAHLGMLQERLLELRTTVIEDKPLHGDVVLVDMFGDTAEDLLGWLEDAVTAAWEARQALEQPRHMERAARALTTCQERFNRISHRFWSDLVSYEQIAELTSLGRQRGGEWRAWANGVKEAMALCQQPWYAVNQSLFRYWQEVVEWMGATAVSGQAINIGQQMTAPEGGP